MGLRQKISLKDRINNKLRNQSQTELEKISVFPNEIILIIMSMLPLEDENWRQHISSQQKMINAKSNTVLIIKYVYPFIRFFSNVINFVIIIIHYTHWHTAHVHNSQWNKYCAFIIALLYMPIHKGRATMRWFGFPIWFKDDDNDRQTPWIVACFFQMFAEWIFVAIFMIISIPILISGIFIYMPTTLLFMLWMCGSTTVIFVLFMNKSEDIGGWSGMTVSLTIGMIFILNVIIICTLEFYANGNWIKSYRIGMRGEYCDESDYFSFDKWNDYDWDIRFLII